MQDIYKVCVTQALSSDNSTS